MASTVAVRECKGCYHPQPARDSVVKAITKLGVMREKSRDGCLTCTVLLQGVRSCDPSVESLTDEAPIRIEFNARGVKSLEVLVYASGILVSFFTLKGRRHSPSRYSVCHRRGLTVYLETSPGIARLLPSCSQEYDLPRTTSSEESLLWAAEQLRRCGETHEKCASQSNPVLPRRVLDIGQNAGDVVRLYETKRESGRYACLSYCWGREPFLRTTATNFAAHQEQVPWDQLPPTHQETITVVRLLGIRYLWIDSLCIIQDDRGDWRREARDMTSIYKQAYLIISASKSFGPKDGLFSTILENHGPHKLTVSIDGEDLSKIYARTRFAHVSQALWRPKQSESHLPVFSRGWTLQERFLARRILHFNAEEIAWECLEDSACQCSGVDSPAQPLSRSREAAKALSKYEPDTTGSSLGPKWRFNPSHWRGMGEQALRQSWHDLVEGYSHLRLTYESDIFPAISGIAKELQAVTGSEYLAGLWERSLLVDLCWYTSFWGDANRAGERPTQWRAPTWSWASVMGSVAFATAADLIDSCQILEANCTAVGADPTGELTSGQLVLKGLLVPTDLLYKPQAEAKDTAPWQTFDLGLLRGKMGNQHADYKSCLEREGRVLPETTVYCFLLGRMQQTGTLCFLVLRQVGGSGDSGDSDEVKPLVYERMGFVELFWNQFPKDVVMEDIRSLGQESVVTII